MDVRPSIGGAWYPRDPQRLAQSLESFLAHADEEPLLGKLWGVVVPHAGHRYSGQVAAHAFRCLRGLRPELIVVVSPFHSPTRKPLLTTGHEAYETPLGLIEVDRQALESLNHALRNRLGIGLTPIRNDPEHSLEVELPFLQKVLEDFRLLPVMISDQSAAVAEVLGHALAESLSQHQAILAASSDLSHFYPQETARELDMELLRRLGEFDPSGLIEAESEGVGFACGRGAIAAVLWAARDLGADSVKVLKYATSGDVSGDYGSVVGYAAAAVLQATGMPA